MVRGFSKYLVVFSIGWESEFVYRLSFILWRIRNLFRFFTTFYLWNSIFISNNLVFGYAKSEILTYLFIVQVVSSIIISGRAFDVIGGEIADGKLSNYLVKPISYVGYWLSQDLSNKLLNLIFSIFEIGTLWLILQPTLNITNSFVIIFGFIISCFFAVLINFYLGVVSRLAAFWIPESTWGISFVVIVLLEIFSGLFFPLNVLPKALENLLQFTPFPYLIYYPAQIILGKLSAIEVFRIIVQSFLWFVILLKITDFVFKKGLLRYSSEGH